ncbi:MAG: YaiI/YqxD family protein [Proteobacteria bacterium]|nr:YaiI/YqxD family protein [Pseudomonadota bacterium]MCP4917303.1 YaiI/YqxD family protein [Pseudomonadota bacterium]
MSTIWIDGDGVPRACKEILFKAALRTKCPTVLVANSWQQVPKLAWITFVQVSGGLDVADDHIAESCQPGDLVITSDVPLAARVCEAGGTVVTFRGQALDQANVQQRLGMRDFMDDLRGTGVMTGGPPPYGPKDKQRFANSLDRWLSRRPAPGSPDPES